MVHDLVHRLASVGGKAQAFEHGCRGLVQVSEEVLLQFGQNFVVLTLEKADFLSIALVQAIDLLLMILHGLLPYPRHHLIIQCFQILDFAFFLQLYLRLTLAGIFELPVQLLNLLLVVLKVCHMQVLVLLHLASQLTQLFLLCGDQGTLLFAFQLQIFHLLVQALV